MSLCIFSLVPRDLPRGMPRKRVRFSEAVQFAPPAQDSTEDEEDEGNATVEEDEETASMEVKVVENTEDALRPPPRKWRATWRPPPWRSRWTKRTIKGV